MRKKEGVYLREAFSRGRAFIRSNTVYTKNALIHSHILLNAHFLWKSCYKRRWKLNPASNITSLISLRACYTHVFYKQGKKLFTLLYAFICFIVLFYCSIVLSIVLQSNLQPNYARVSTRSGKVRNFRKLSKMSGKSQEKWS